MPLLWRYLLRNFFKSFFLCIGTFICVLIVLRAQHIAKFAATKDGLYTTLLFTLLQLPYILPFAISFSSLLASFLVAQNLDLSGSITSLRSCGLSFKEIFFPLYCLSIILGLLNFLVISELSPYSKKKTKELLNTSFLKHPLALLEDRQFQNSRGVLPLFTSTSSSNQQNIMIAFSRPYPKQLSLILAQELTLHHQQLQAKNAHVFSSSKELDHTRTLVESYEDLHTCVEKMIPRYKKHHPTLTFEELSTKKCLANLKVTCNKERVAGYFEMLKRAFFFTTPIAFVFLATACATQSSRSRKSSLKTLVFWTILVLASYFLGKSFEKHPAYAAWIFFTPQCLIVTYSLAHLHKIRKGLIT